MHLDFLRKDSPEEVVLVSAAAELKEMETYVYHGRETEKNRGEGTNVETNCK